MKKNTLIPAVFIFSKAGWLLFGFILLLPCHVFSQISIHGKVSSLESGETLPGVSILVKGTNTGSSTDLNGDYKLEVAYENDILIFSFIGYTTQEIAVNQRCVIDVVLADDVQGLDEVVVVGYGTAKKATLSGAISTVEGADLKNAPVVNVGQSLA